jgi:hypothetical protein
MAIWSLEYRVMSGTRPGGLFCNRAKYQQANTLALMLALLLLLLSQQAVNDF